MSAGNGLGSFFFGTTFSEGRGGALQGGRHEGPRDYCPQGSPLRLPPVPVPSNLGMHRRCGDLQAVYQQVWVPYCLVGCTVDPPPGHRQPHELCFQTAAGEDDGEIRRLAGSVQAAQVPRCVTVAAMP